MNYTKNEKITKVQIEKIRKKLNFCQWFLFSFFPIHESITSHLKNEDGRNALMDGAERREKRRMEEMKEGKEKNCEVELRMKLNTTLNHQSADMAPKGRRNNFFLTLWYSTALQISRESPQNRSGCILFKKIEHSRTAIMAFLLCQYHKFFQTIENKWPFLQNRFKPIGTSVLLDQYFRNKIVFWCAHLDSLDYWFYSIL